MHKVAKKPSHLESPSKIEYTLFSHNWSQKKKTKNKITFDKLLYLISSARAATFYRIRLILPTLLFGFVA